MNDKRLHNEPSDVDADEGQVLVDGPDGVAVALTPEAAAETGNRLIDGAGEAAGQRYIKHRGLDRARPAGERAKEGD